MTLFDLFNEAEESREGIMVEPDEAIVILSHNIMAQRKRNRLLLPSMLIFTLLFLTNSV